MASMQISAPDVRKHHYAWAYYLSGWSSEGNKKIWQMANSESISNVSVKSLYNEEDFNKITKLSDEDISYIESWPSSNSEALRKIHNSQLAHLKTTSTLIDGHAGLEKSKEYSELKNLSDTAQYNMFERTHTALELLAKPIIEKLKTGNAACLEKPSNMIRFCNFLAQQRLKSNDIREQCFEGFKHLPQNYSDREKHLELFNKNWWLISYRMALDFGHSLSHSAVTDNHTLIRNTTDIDFLTSDCPAINIHESVQSLPKWRPPSELDLYFPISPKIAYVISSSNKYNDLAHTISEKTVKELNIKILQNSKKSIYGNSREAIENVRNNYKLDKRAFICSEKNSRQ